MDSDAARWVWPAVVAVTAGVVAALFGGWVSGAVALTAAAVAAALATREGTELPPAALPAPPSPPAIPLAGVLDAIPSPVLVLRDGRVVVANVPARALLGAHIVGEDVRVALRHPAATERLGNAATPEPERPVELVGLGTLDQRWLMRVGEAGDGSRVVHLADETGFRDAERMRVDFVANASHELRTPLASILGYAETLADEAGEDAGLRRRFLQVMTDEARRMQRLVEDLLSLSRIEGDRHRAPTMQVDLGALCAAVCAELHRADAPRVEDLVCSVEPDLPPVAGDPAQLSQLLHNLVGNALKYGRAGTPVTLSLTAAQAGAATLRLVVTDQGDGIAPEHIPRLTERFYRVDAGRSRSLGGTGLGLSIVKHIVERHRGRLDITSRPGVGTTVAVTLPAGPAPGAAVTKP